MFYVAPFVKLMFCFLQWLGALLCHGEIKGFHGKISRCIVVIFYLFTQKHNINPNHCVSENHVGIVLHLKPSIEVIKYFLWRKYQPDIFNVTVNMNCSLQPILLLEGYYILIKF